MTYHTQNSNSSYSRKGGRFVKIKDNIEAPKGFHYMADGKLMNDLSKEKYNFIRALELQKKEDGLELLSDEKLPILPEWNDQL